ncbi:thioredoxin reductase [Cadophora sp. MPI-SDFR-AT-0126]|nr:thioredoxin reductase [Leotiomycetes sp. MPI-SDFR-AT-0126]
MSVEPSKFRDRIEAKHAVPRDSPALDTTVIDENLVASISRLLTDHGIPCILWGNYLLTVYGVPSIVNSIDFMVPDEMVAASVSALSNTGLATCSEPKTCTVVAESRASPPPAAHYHIIDSELSVCIYQKSSAFWFLPSLELSCTSKSQPADIILASDSRLPGPRPGRGHGRFKADTFPVCIPSAHRLLEAYLRLIAKPREPDYECFWMSMEIYIEEYVDRDGYLDETALDSRCRLFYSAFKAGKKPIEILAEMKASPLSVE